MVRGRPVALEPLDQRTVVMLARSTVERVDAWALAGAIRGRSEAIRRLLELGLAADAAGWSPEAPPPKAKRGRKGTA